MWDAEKCRSALHTNNNNKIDKTMTKNKNKNKIIEVNKKVVCVCERERACVLLLLGIWNWIGLVGARLFAHKCLTWKESINYTTEPNGWRRRRRRRKKLKARTFSLFSFLLLFFSRLSWQNVSAHESIHSFFRARVTLPPSPPPLHRLLCSGGYVPCS